MNKYTYRNSGYEIWIHDDADLDDGDSLYRATDVDALLREVLEVKASYGIPDTATRVYKRIAEHLGL